MSQLIICYDLDGTIIDSAPSLYESIKFSCIKEKIKYPEFNKFKSSIGPPLQFYLKQLLSINESQEKQIISNFRYHHDNEGYKYYLLYDHIVDVLGYFQEKKIDQYIITNKPENLTLKAISYLGISKFFKSIFSTRKKGEEMKKKSFYLDKLKSNNVVYYIGDTEEDKKEADKSNCIFIFADYGYGSIENPKNIISKPYQLIDKIKI